MFPYLWNQQPVAGIGGMNLGVIPGLADPDLRDLPEEVRQALESHRDEIHSAADLRSFAADQILRR